MHKAQITLKTLDYHKYRSIIISGEDDELERCSKEVRAFYEIVQTLRTRKKSFKITTNQSIENDNDAFSFDHNNAKTTTSNVNDGFTSDRQRLMSICGYYKLMTEARRVAPIDVKLRSGWWGASKSPIDAGKVKIAGLKEELLMKQKESTELQNLRSIEASKVKNGKIATSPTSTSSTTSSKFQSVIDTDSELNFSKLIDGHASIYALQHKRLPCFQYIGYSDHVLQTMHDLLTLAFEAEVSGALVAALLTSTSSDWRFHFLPLKCENEDEIRWAMNDAIIRHDSVWPRGLNDRFYVSNLKDSLKFRESCLRHHWPPSEQSSHVTGPISSTLPTVESSTFMAPPAIQGNEKFASTLKQCINKYNNYNYTNNNNNNEEQCCSNDVYQTTKQQLLQHLSSKQYKGVTTTMTTKSLYSTVEGLSLEDIEMSSSCHARYHHHHKHSTSKDNNNCVGNYNINFDNIINNNIITTTNNNINNKTLNSLKNCRRSNSCTNNSRDTFNKMYVEVDDNHKGNGEEEEEEDEMYRFNLPFKLKNSLLFGDRKNLSLNKLEKDEVGASGKNKALQIRSKSSSRCSSSSLHHTPSSSLQQQQQRRHLLSSSSLSSSSSPRYITSALSSSSSSPRKNKQAQSKHTKKYKTRKKFRDGDDSDDENDSEDYDEDKGCARYKDKNKSRSRSSSSSSSSSSLMSSITATTVKTALEVNELERNRQDLLLKLSICDMAIQQQQQQQQQQQHQQQQQQQQQQKLSSTTFQRQVAKQQQQTKRPTSAALPPSSSISPSSSKVLQNLKK